VSESDEAAIHVERGRVPDLGGLNLKAAIQQVVMVGGVPKIEGRAEAMRGARVVARARKPARPSRKAAS
jgi:cell division protein FtsI (penicillin-binding protein 3)